MRVISMVPSWTETLLCAGVEVVGRTRFCIHPSEKIKAIPAVGGTKDINWQKVEALKPDLVIFDREENPREMSEACPYPWIATHVTGIESVAGELELLERAASGGGLSVLTERWRRIEKAQPLELDRWIDLPGVVEWLRLPRTVPEKTECVYVIWREPWMAVSAETFIGSVLNKVGVNRLLPLAKGLYPEFDIELLPQEALLLFSSEPFPFQKKRADIERFGRPSALVDGEMFSWFGIRTLGFLESALRLKSME